MRHMKPHNSVVQLLGVVANPLCVVTAFYQNGSLYTLLHSDKEMTFQNKLNVIYGIVSGMVHLHEERIIHRDLAARNILLDRNMDAVVADFGLSRAVVDVGSGNVTSSNVGPLKWMAPECLQNHKYSQKSDVFAFGVVCYEVIMRKDPWENLTPVLAAMGVIQRKRLALPMEGAVCPAALSNIVAQCFHENPDARPSFKEIWKQLNNSPSLARTDK